jgi:alpha-L-fucosidase
MYTGTVKLVILVPALVLLAYGEVLCSQSEPATEKFEPTVQSLAKYRCPAWFRDAKLGIFMHWGLCSVPAYDDWYPRHMYMEGHKAYKHHVEIYGHPSKFGYKDFVPMWKAEKFDPNSLITLYKAAGAKYVVPVAVHHDNFDLWDSTYHRWNSVNMGPKKDIVGMWRTAVLKAGLRFGVSSHVARSYSWFNVSKGSDKSGPHAGVPYDGADANYSDFYHEPHGDISKRYPGNPSRQWVLSWYNRTKELVDKYKPDLLYLDGGVPFGQTGLEMVAHYFNENMRWHDGRLEAVFNIKKGHGFYDQRICVLDLERRVTGAIRPQPWQTDTSVGSWFYIDGAPYKSVDTIIDNFIDIVSKNGNMLLNVAPRADGTLDERTQKILREIGAWMEVNSEGIYSTRPWKVFGEGSTAEPTQKIKRDTANFGPDDIRFTQKHGAVYAFVLGWPGDGSTVTIRSLAADSQSRPISDVSLLGYDGALEWKQDAQSLKVRLPSEKPCEHALVVKIVFEG